MNLNRMIKEASERIIGVNLRVKIIGLVITLLVLLAGTTMFQTAYSITPFLYQQLDLQALTIAKYLADRSPEYIYRGEVFRLYTAIRDAKNSNDNIRYIFITNEKEEVIANTFGNSIPRGLVQANKVNPSETYGVSVIETEEGSIRDIALPIAGGKLGVVRVGMSEKRLLSAKSNMLRGIAITTLVVLLLGLFFTLFLSRILTAPFQRLIQATREVAAGNMNYRVPLWPAKDEAGELTSAFNDMIDKIERSAQEIDQLSTLRRGLAHKLMIVQEEERKHLARELHDQTSQSLASLRIGLKYVEDAQNLYEVKQRVSEARHVLDETFDGIRHLVTSLRPYVLDEGGLGQAIVKYTRDFETRYDIEVDLGIDEIPELPNRIASSLFRIVQEVLTNVARHAQASQISIILSSTLEDIYLTIEDDGVGFDVKEVLSQRTKNKKFGLFGIQERAMIFGGNLQIESEPGQGTTIYVKIPREVLRSGGY